MKKTFKMIAITTIMLIVLTSCGDKEQDTTTTKPTTTKAQTTVVNVTDTNGVAVTNTDGKVITEVVTIKNGTTQKVETTKAPISTTTTTAPTTKTPTTKAKVTTTAPQTTARPTTTTAPTTTVQANLYGYKNAWGTIAQMEADCKANAESMGMIYRTDYTLETGHWVTPNSSYGAPSPEAFKAKFCGSDIITSYQKSGYTNIRVLFVTMDNYKDGRCGKYTSNAEMYLNDDSDKIIVYVVVT